MISPIAIECEEVRQHLLQEIAHLWITTRGHKSPIAIECEEVRQHLLQEIAHLWITTRGHSKARKIKEDYKVAKGKSVKGKHSLRKELHITSSIQSNEN